MILSSGRENNYSVTYLILCVLGVMEKPTKERESLKK
jgi:hypothetical protein